MMLFDKYTLFAILVICIFSCLYLYIENESHFVSAKSTLDDKTYEVRDTNTDNSASIKQITSEDSANRLASIKKDTDKLVNYMYSKGLPDRDTATRLHDRWANSSLKETSESSKNIAYTINKGQEVHLCIRSSDKQFENYNTSIFVILHELAHIMSKSYGHQSEFKDNFTILLTYANKLGIYRLQNFNERPETYCGTKIDNSPCSYNNMCT